MLSRKYQRKRRKCSNCCIVLAALKLLFTTFVGCSLCPWMCINGWKTSGKRFVFLWLKKRYKNAGHLPFCLVWALVYLNFSTYSLNFFFPLTFQLNYWQFRFFFSWRFYFLKLIFYALTVWWHICPFFPFLASSLKIWHWIFFGNIHKILNVLENVSW